MNSDGGLNRKNQQLLRFIGELAAKYGHAQIEAAILSISGEGFGRRIMLQGLFSKSDLDIADLCLRLSALPDSDVLAATVGIGNKLSLLDPLESFPADALLLLPLSNPRVASEVAGSLVGNISRLNVKDPESARLAVRSHFQVLLSVSENGEAASDLLRNYINGVAKEFPFDAWDLRQDYDSKKHGNLDLDSIVTEMMVRDPGRAIAGLQGGDMTQDSAGMMIKAVRDWIRIDPEQLSRLRSSGVSLNGYQSDLLTAGLASHELKNGNFQSALSAMEVIKTPVLLSETRSFYNAARGEQLRAAAKQNPQATISELTGGSPGKEPFWVEVVVDEWLKYDMQGSYNWYQKNSKTLSNAQSERFALAYARAAIREKELDTARSWTLLIHDPELRALVEDEITDAPD